MTKSEFQDLQIRASSSGKTLKEFLRSEGVAYSTYNYWSRKTKLEEARALPIAPISIRGESRKIHSDGSKPGIGLPGVTVAFPNGVRAHFGDGSDCVLMEILTQSMCGHVLPQ